MGYTTDFEGRLTFDKPLTQKQVKYINLLSETRRMKRNVNKLMKLYKGEHGNPFAKDKTDPQQVYGHQGQYFAFDDGHMGQHEDGTIIDYNTPAGNPNEEQPSLWCQWVITEDGKHLEWDGNEKFYDYIKWLEYLIENFFTPWKKKLSGEINWYGEERSDIGKIKVDKNKVSTHSGEIAFSEEPEPDKNVGGISSTLIIIGCIFAVGATLALIF